MVVAASWSFGPGFAVVTSFRERNHECQHRFGESLKCPKRSGIMNFIQLQDEHIASRNAHSKNPLHPDSFVHYCEKKVENYRHYIHSDREISYNFHRKGKHTRLCYYCKRPPRQSHEVVVKSRPRRFPQLKRVYSKKPTLQNGRRPSSRNCQD